MDYSAKHVWQSAEKAAAYRVSRDPSRYKRYYRENQIVMGWLIGLNAGASILDIPCGAGRFTQFFNDMGFRYVGADFSCAMIREARESEVSKSSVGFANADAEHLPFADRSFDCIILWRFLHHVADPQARLHILREASRVARDRVIISFYHPISFTYLRRAMQHRLAGKGDYRAAITQWRLARDAAQCGLRVAACKSFRPYISINWFACLEVL